MKKVIMPLLLVTFDLNKSGQDYSDLLNKIKSYSNVQLSKFSYAIITDKTPDAVYREIKKYIDTNDSIYIVNLKRPYAGYGSELVTDWLKKELID
jgi:CRISPR-associated endonuclease Cas2